MSILRLWCWPVGAKRLRHSRWLARIVPFAENRRQGALTEIAGGGGFDKLRELVRKIRLADPGLKLASESGINTLGYNLLARKKYPEAIGILQMNTEDFPESSNTYDSLAEAQFKSGDLAHALENYRRALEVDPKYGNADFAKKFLEEKGTKK